MGGREGGGAERTFEPSPPPPPPLRSIVQNTVHEGNVVLLFFADLTIYIKM